MSYGSKTQNTRKYCLVLSTILLPRTRFGDLRAKHLSVRPQVNPIERFWQDLNERLSWQLFDSLELKNQVTTILNSLKEEIIQSLTGWDEILQALSLLGL